MKKTFLLLILALVPLVAAVAQSIVLGERVPEVKPSAWLKGEQPAEAPMTYVEFFAAANPACLTSLERLHTLTSKLNTKLRVIVVSMDNEEKIASLATPYLSPSFTVALDPQGRIFAAYDVSYVPFGVLTDARNRALWQGNSLQFTEKVIENSK